MAFSLPSPRRGALLVVALFLVFALGCAAATYTRWQMDERQDRIAALHRQVSDAQELQLLIAESQSAMRHWMITGTAEDRDASARALDALQSDGRSLAGRLAPLLAERGLPALGASLEHVLRTQQQARRLVEESGIAGARDALLRGNALSTVMQLRGVLAEFRNLVEARTATQVEALRRTQLVGLLLVGAAAVAMLALLLGSVTLLARRRRAAEQAHAEMDRRGRNVATLFRMGELLQSSLSPEDVRNVVAHTARELLPELGGAFYVFNNSRDRLDLLGSWPAGDEALPQLAEYFVPHECWALKRGRPHGCGLEGGLSCEHAACGSGSGSGRGLCVPMHARSEVYGVLRFLPGSRQDGLPEAGRALAQALADGVSLALANLALREKLRNQALRDELTGLHNRRFMEEALPRLVAHADRRGAPLAVLMLDLDHFKQINDRYGHASGDAVLREVGALLLARLRRMDMACRYGGEELLVVMPDCSAQEALIRAQELCANIRALRDRAASGLPAVTVSIGVAAWPEHGEQMGKVIEAADAALYTAKRAGRDRAMPAEAAMASLPMPG